MELSWLKVQNKHNLEKIHFKEYFQHIGRPFNKILNILGINKNISHIRNTYQQESIKQINKLSYYRGALGTLKKLKSRKHILAIVTSKDLIRTNKFLGKNNKLFSVIKCDKKNNKGKPYPYNINEVIKLMNVKKSQCIYIGDTYIDYQTAKNSRIDFLFAKWGYGADRGYKYVCSRITDLPNFLN